MNLSQDELAAPNVGVDLVRDTADVVRLMFVFEMFTVCETLNMERFEITNGRKVCVFPLFLETDFPN